MLLFSLLLSIAIKDSATKYLLVEVEEEKEEWTGKHQGIIILKLQ